MFNKSGSMHCLQKDVVGGFNALIDEQNKEGATKVTTVFLMTESTLFMKR